MFCAHCGKPTANGSPGGSGPYCVRCGRHHGPEAHPRATAAALPSTRREAVIDAPRAGSIVGAIRSLFRGMLAVLGWGQRAATTQPDEP